MDSDHSPKRFKPESLNEEVFSEKMETDAELSISRILESIQTFTQLVSELLESGKAYLKELSDEFEERVIAVHKERIDKWNEEIKELRSLNESNEEADALLHNARFLLQNPSTST